MIFRSGNADGSDQLFSNGVASIDNKRLQVNIPYADHRKKTDQAYDIISFDKINIAAEAAVIYQSKGNKKTEKLVDNYVLGARGRYSIKADYIIRSTIKAIGTEEIRPATFGIFYDDLDKPKEGGTGHTMNVCIQNNIPILTKRYGSSG